MFKPAVSTQYPANATLNARRYKRPARWHLDLADWRTQTLICLITVGAVIYNALLAMVSARGAPMNGTLVGACEVVLLCAAVAIIVAGGLTRRDFAPLTLLYSFVMLAILLSAINGFMFMNAARNIAIMAVFTMLGLRAHEVTVRRTVMIAAGLTLLVLLLEIVSTSSYVYLFAPAQYYEKTRGTVTQDWDTSGLFQNASGFASRFTFGLLNHRSASLFLEQVSLANFAAVLSVTVLSLWGRLSILERLFLIGVSVLIVLTNSTRTGSALVLASIPGYFIYPLLPRWGTALLAPAAVGAAALIVWHTGVVLGDDIAGRMSVTINALSTMDLGTMLGGHVARTEHLMDSGYGYAIASSTLFGLMIICGYVAAILPQATPDQKRCAYGVGFYFAVNLLIGGTAIFSMKVAAPLWLLVGFLLVSPAPSDTPPPRWRVW
jgi:hypothetical protein